MCALCVIGIPSIKCKEKLLEYLRERREREAWRVDAVGVARRQPIKCKDIVLEYLS